jgi:Heterokaryon incompatibility protein (HET)
MADPDQIQTLGPSVKFARFTTDGQKIALFSSRTTELDYIAVSHVWGNSKWRTVSFLDDKILASKNKVKFIEEQLFGLVGTQAFWFDTITVNQRVTNEVTATKQAISSIFRDAEKTLVVREGDGLYSCCEEAVRGFSGYGEFVDLINRHAIKHLGDAMKESYLKRLWPLQECLLSHTLQFTTCGDGKRAEAVF